ncbi:gustatory and odorant receptor 24 [Neocloeon triangulifer]|uniref:gustatory and odorant receptor 24 n=1 Tax=Neocloeon triangulifer TaxID=2078957 RepID=UPI00286F6117|nr:gustatory and odorant receptor 24 [Neocloeon triangulifer]
MASRPNNGENNIGFSEQTDAYLRRILMDRVYANDDVLFTKTFKPPKDDDKIAPSLKTPQATFYKDDIPSLTQANRPFYTLLRALGCVPYDLNPRGDVTANKFVVVYSIAFYCIVLYAVYQEAPKSLNFSGTLDNSVDNMGTLVSYAKVALVPFIIWLPFRRVSNFFKATFKFHMNFFRMTGEVIVLEWEKYTPYIATGIPVFSACIVLYYYLSMHEIMNMNILTLLLSWSTYVVTIGMDFLWCTPLMILGKTAERLISSLKNKFQKVEKDSAMQEYLVREYRALWLDLSKALQSNNDVSTMTFTYHALHVFLMLTLNLYGLLNGLRQPWSTNQNMRLIGTILFLVELWLMANAAHYCTTKFEDIQWDPFFLIPSIETAEAVRREMSTFLDVAVAAPHVVDIGGFVCINRSWLTNMLGNLLSSLIILLQFRVQQTDEPLTTPSPSIVDNKTTLTGT